MFALALPVSLWHHFLMVKSMKKFLILCSPSQGLEFFKKICGCCTEGCGLVVALAPQLASMCKVVTIISVIVYYLQI